MSANTIRLHRVLRATPEKVYRAFLDGDAMVKWLPPRFRADLGRRTGPCNGGVRLAPIQESVLRNRAERRAGGRVG
jgi:uncharacterized protein YndB with AHSA1/START domain